jgi:hypothetical protein
MEIEWNSNLNLCRRIDTEAWSRRVQERLMKTALAFWKGSTVPEASRSTQLRRLFKRSCLISAAVLCLSAFQHEAQAQTVISQCTNPVCTPGSGSVGTSWLASMETVFKNFVNQIVVAKLVPVIAAYFVLKATLDGAAGENPLGSIVAALFLMSLSATMQLMQGWNSGGQYAMTDMLTSLWNYIAGQIMPAAAGLACVGAVINFVRHRPWTRLVFAAISFLSVSGLLALFQAMAA